MTAIGTAVAPKVEVVRYFLRLPDEESEDKVVYIEPDVPAVLINENLDGYQRSVMPFRVKLYGYINEPDTRVLIDFVHEILDALNTPTARESFRVAFAPSSYDGFTIEQVTLGGMGFGEEYGQFEMTIETMVNHPN
jgi:hypothetical protein